LLVQFEALYEYMARGSSNFVGSLILGRHFEAFARDFDQKLLKEAPSRLKSLRKYIGCS
jgi:hypothetical protein